MPRAPFPRHVVSTIRWASTARKARPPPPPKATTPRPIQPLQPPQPEPVSIEQTLPPLKPRKPSPWPWIVGLTFGAGFGFYCLQLAIAIRKPCTNPGIAELANQKDVADRYDYTAESFDSEVGLSELIMGVNRIRKRLAAKCTGHVLEVSCGTGRNLGYYDIGKEGKVESLTFIDLSSQMVDVCKKKWAAFYGGKNARDELKEDLVVRFMTGSALDDMPPAPTGKRYDTIIQTMGLCSTPSPGPLLTNMAKHLDTSNPDARILLLEHGRSYMGWLNNILDGSAQKHAEIHGCWFNREIGQLVEEAADQSGLEIVDERRWHGGTTWLFELRPKTEAVKTVAASPPAPAVEQTKRGWFN